MNQPADVYLRLREQMLTVGADTLAEPAAGRILALLMETADEEAVVTLVGLADGTTSLYFSNGGGMIGAGEHERVAAATRRWLGAAEGFLESFTAAPDDPGLPRDGEAQFVAVTEDGRSTLRAAENDLEEGRHPAAPLFYAAHDVITEMRLVEEGRRK
jgi:hypothetical protein